MNVGNQYCPPPPPSGFRLGHQTSASEGSILSLYTEKRRGIMKRPVFEAEKDQGKGSRLKAPCRSRIYGSRSRGGLK